MKKSFFLIVGIMAVLIVSGCVQEKPINLEKCGENIDSIRDLEIDVPGYILYHSYSTETLEDPLAFPDGSSRDIEYELFASIGYLGDDRKSQAEIRFHKFSTPQDYHLYKTGIEKQIADFKREFDVRTSDFFGYEMMEIDIVVPEDQKAQYLFDKIYTIDIPEINLAYRFAFNETGRGTEREFIEEYINGICK